LPATTTAGAASVGGFATGGALGTESQASNWTVRFRAHKDFLP
jgi:hypothetical protein